MLAAEALHRDKPVGQRGSVPPVARDLVLEGLVQDLLHPAELLLRPREELVPHRPVEAAGAHPVVGRLQRRPAQRLRDGRRHEDRAPAGLVAEDHLHLPGRDAVVVLVVPAAVAEGPVHVVAVAHDQVPLAEVVHHEVAEAHRPPAHVALAVHEAVIPPILVGAGLLEAELAAGVRPVAVGGRFRLQLAAHLLPDELVQRLVDAVRVLAADLDVPVPSGRHVLVRVRAELDHEQGGLRLLLRLGAGELHLLLTDDPVRVLPRVGRETSSVAQQQRPSLLAEEARQLERALAEVVGQALQVVEVVGHGVLLVAVHLAALPEVGLVLRAAPLLLHVVVQHLGDVTSVAGPVDLDVPLRAQLHHDVLLAVLHELVVAEDQLLLALVASAPKVAAVAGDHRPLHLLHHEVDELHRALAHVVLPLRAPALEGRRRVLLGAVIRVVLGLAATPLRGEECPELFVEAVRVRAVDLDVPALPQLDHDERRDQVQRVRGLELDLLLPDLPPRAQVPRVADVERPAALVRHKVHEVHGELAHVVLALSSSALVDAVPGGPAVATHLAEGPAHVAHAVVVRNVAQLKLRGVAAAAAVLIVFRHPHQVLRQRRDAPVVEQPAAELLVDAAQVLPLHLHEAQ
mmetsp:Transcript_65449/g.141413  ORF Transcript_65449/g.141413 Transcript_65449/m.141413 type:complete len:629 (-) Transcript_65449:217-2103(-)